MGIAAQAIAVAALREALGVEDVSTQLPPPEHRGATFIVVSRIGGGASDWAIKDPRFLIECYAPDELSAERFADDTWEAWQKLRTPPVSTARADNNLAPYENPDTTHIRFQFTGTLRLRR